MAGDDRTLLDIVWRNGHLERREEAVVALTDLGLPFIQWVFEGIKAHWDGSQLYLFRLDEHLIRFAESMRLNQIHPPVNLDDIRRGIIEVLRANDVRRDVHLRPMAYLLGGALFALPETLSAEVLVYGDLFTSQLRQPKLIRLAVSSWQRIDEFSTPPRIKAAANYHNARLAYVQARRDGYDRALMLNRNGGVAETEGAALMMVKGDRLVTPALTEGVLDSITRRTLLEAAPDVLGVRVEERRIERSELLVADEVFLCGTGAEVLAVGQIDSWRIGDAVGPRTAALQQWYDDVIRGRRDEYRLWLTPVY